MQAHAQQSRTEQIANFLRTGWELVSKDDAETNQEVIKALSTEAGLTIIKTSLHDGSTESRVALEPRAFMSQVLPLLQIISHRSILSSLILEIPLDKIYTFLFGINGRRAIELFRSLVPALAAFAIAEEGSNEKLCYAAVGSTLAVLEKILELNQTAQVLAEFVSFEGQLTSTIPARLIQPSIRSLTRIRQRLGVGADIPLAGSQSSPLPINKVTFKMDIDLPGALSKLGRRHDNDHEEISEIQILPTTDEIRSVRSAYLPSTDLSKLHLPGPAGLLDRHFRMLREDTVGQVRDAVQVELERLSTPEKARKPISRLLNGARHSIYHDVKLSSLEFDPKKGLQVVAEFNQPKALTKLGTLQREQWWKNSKQLQVQSFVCFVSSTGRAIFFYVCDSALTPVSKRHDDNEEEPDLRWAEYEKTRAEPLSLSKDANRACVMLSLVENRWEDVEWIVNQIGNFSQFRQSLVEFPGILLPSFKPTLQALQRMSKMMDFPFSNLIAPATSIAVSTELPLPAYAREPDFGFDLSTLVNGETLVFRPGRDFNDALLQERSTLDNAQRVSTISALSRGLALIQGPPGTGKSFTGVAIIKALLANREAAGLGPILCVCYTNHALDQLLEHLVSDGVQQIVRLGYQSKSELLKNLTISQVSHGIERTKTERTEEWSLREQLRGIFNDIAGLMPALRDPAHLNNVKNYLALNHKRHFEELFEEEIDKDGFRLVRGKKFNALEAWIKEGARQNTPVRTIQELEIVKLQSMTGPERMALRNFWVQQTTADLTDRLQRLLGIYREVDESLRRCYQERNLRCLLATHVIGATTSGLANNLDVLRRVPMKAVIIEEAGEVLEAHTLTALLPSIEHAILIGDHEQLRPQINNYEFQHENPRGAKFALDISLFERLIRPQHGGQQIPYCSLEVQRRMHPSIAKLIRSTLYPSLQDHDAVSTYPEIEGFRKRLFWLDHDNREESLHTELSSSYSKTNKWEVEMTAALVTHLVRQGIYRSDEIAILTPYLGQLHELKNRLRDSFTIVVGDRDLDDLASKGIVPKSGEDPTAATGNIQKISLLNALRIATVDNFQGEEAKVVVISLVRSNGERKCGFLKTSNRINVLLSRAQHGMYIIGNAQTARSVPMWNEVITILESDSNIGRSLALCCPRHKETPIEVATPDDFAVLSPEGGCNQKCVSRLPCGHACINMCHSEPMHNVVRCLERCRRTKKGCDHPCPKVCGDLCDAQCQYSLSSITLPCGHVQDRLPCHLAQNPKLAECQAKVETKMVGCHHVVKVRCCQLPLAPDYPCKAICDAALPCGHRCKLACKKCTTKEPDGQISKVEHDSCTNRCGRDYTTCGHSCTKTCHGKEPCQLCNESCASRCTHSKCNKKCHEPCAPCAEDCTWACQHRGACELPCAVPCDRLPCSQRCMLALSCGHQCPSVCGERCPDVRYCQRCSDQSIKTMMVDYIMGLTYMEIDLDETPCLVPSCGHILTMENMDGVMDMSSYYEIDERSPEPIVSLKSCSRPFSSSGLKKCPMCRTRMGEFHRYGRIIRRAWIDEATKKFLVWANAQFLPLEQQMTAAEAKFREPSEGGKTSQQQLSMAFDGLSLQTIELTGSPDQQISHLLKGGQISARHSGIMKVRRAIKKHLHQVGEVEQPISRIHALVEDARRHRGIIAQGVSDVDPPTILQVRNKLLATALLLRCDYAILYNFISPTGEKVPACSVDLAINRQICMDLQQESHHRSQPTLEAESLLFFARFAALERGHSSRLSLAEMDALVKHARDLLNRARAICTSHPEQTLGMISEIDGAEKMLRDSTFYEPVTNEEKAQIYSVMAGEFQGTGHWYYCVNGHPFTIGECGAPMQTSRCPQCGATVGGTDHQFAEGVTRAADIEAQSRRR